MFSCAWSRGGEFCRRISAFTYSTPGLRLSEDGFDVRVDQPGKHLDHRQMAGPYVAAKPSSVYSGRATIASS
jgi:hypothetical protein